MRDTKTWEADKKGKEKTRKKQAKRKVKGKEKKKGENHVRD